jgi:hypothetical protein
MNVPFFPYSFFYKKLNIVVYNKKEGIKKNGEMENDRKKFKETDGKKRKK